MPDSVSKSGVVKAPADRVLAAITNVADYANWQKEIDAVEVVKEDGEGRPLLAKFTVNAMGMQAHYSTVFEYGPGKIDWELEEGDLMTTNTAHFVVTDNDDGTSKLDVEMLLDIKYKLPDFMISQMITKGVNDYLRGVTRIAEGA